MKNGNFIAIKNIYHIVSNETIARCTPKIITKCVYNYTCQQLVKTSSDSIIMYITGCLGCHLWKTTLLVQKSPNHTA